MGRWLFVELFRMTWPDGSVHGGIGIAVSQGEDPFTEANGGAIAPWTRFYLASAGPSIIDNNETILGPDYPQIGFNGNWIGVQVNGFLLNNSTGSYTRPLAFVFQKAPLECNATIPSVASSIPVCGNATSTLTLGSGQYWYCNDFRFTNATPAESYYTNGVDTSGGLFFGVSFGSTSSSEVKIEEVSGPDASHPSLLAEQFALPGRSGFGVNWTGDLPQLPQAGPSGTPPVIVEIDDRFSQCVVRNVALWCTHTIGLPFPIPDSTAVQWWQIDLSLLFGANQRRILDVERIGGAFAEDANLENTMASGIAANKYGDVAVGFSALNNVQHTSPGYLDVGYVFKGHSQCAEDQYYLYGGGLGPYYDPSQPAGDQQLRTGDYGHTQVEPLTDTGFWTTEGWAGQPIAGGAYGWVATWANFDPAAPQPPTVVGLRANENECTGVKVGDNCIASFSAPDGSQQGDVLLTAVRAGGATSIGIPQGWVLLPFNNLPGTPSSFFTHNNCGAQETDWLAAHVYDPDHGDTGVYSFSVPVVSWTCTNNSHRTEIIWDVVSYRGACGYLNSPAFLQPYFATGFPQTANSTSVSAGSIVPSVRSGLPYDNWTLLNIFAGEQGDTDENEDSCWTWSAISPADLQLKSPNSGCGYTSWLAADRYPVVNGITYGGWSTSDGSFLPKPAWQVLIPPR